MKATKNPFTHSILPIGNKAEIHFIEVTHLTPTLQKAIDESIVEICDPDAETKQRVKKVLHDFFRSKSTNIKMGAVAEFTVHLYLKSIGLRQECLFINLEERSIKKGFDGYYSFVGEEWIMESKSGFARSSSSIHTSKIDTAYQDIKAKVEGSASNNPWSNALKHARVAGTSNDIIRNIRNLSNMYIDGNFPDIKLFNLIPASTIYYDNTSKSRKMLRSFVEIRKALPSYTYNGMKIICIDNNSLKTVLNYLIA